MVVLRTTVLPSSPCMIPARPVVVMAETPVWVAVSTTAPLTYSRSRVVVVPETSSRSR